MKDGRRRQRQQKQKRDDRRLAFEVKAEIALQEDIAHHAANVGALAGRTTVGHQATSTHVIESRGRTTVERVFSLVLLGDLVSLYVAVLRGTDPTPVDVIERLKERHAAALQAAENAAEERAIDDLVTGRAGRTATNEEEPWTE